MMKDTQKERNEGKREERMAVNQADRRQSGEGREGRRKEKCFGNHLSKTQIPTSPSTVFCM